MRHGSQGRRSRGGRGHNGGSYNNGQQPQQRRGNAPNRNQIFDSNGPDVRIRGTAHQVCEKYLALSKDASSIGDIVLAESYMQHAEHYQRIINSWNEEFQAYARANPGYVAPQATEDGNVSDDLALPMSILGGDSKVSDEQTVRMQAPAEQMMETA